MSGGWGYSREHVWMERPGYHRGEVRLRTVEQGMDGSGEVGGMSAGWVV